MSAWRRKAVACGRDEPDRTAAFDRLVAARRTHLYRTHVHATGEIERL